MIYIQQTDNYIILPKHYKLDSDLNLLIVNNLDHTKYALSDLTNVSTQEYYYKFAIDVSDYTSGEYNLTLYSGEFPVYKTLLTVGDYTKTRTEYNKNNTFIQYGE